MKKVLSLLLSLFLVIGLSACSAKTNEEEVVVVEETKEESTVINTSNESERYEFSGELSKQILIDTTIEVEITLNNVKATSEESIIKIENAKSVTIVLVGDNNLETTTADTKAIKSSVDLLIKGDGSLTINSVDTCIKADTNLVIESGTYNLTAGSEGDGLRSDETLVINGGTFVINAGESIESTQITINDGKFDLTSTDDAINASNKSETLTPFITINGGEFNINMAQGDTDAIDSNGDLTVTGGYLSINAQSAFDWDGEVSYTGGTIIVNGQEQTQITNQFEGVFPIGQPGWFPDGRGGH